ncbi:MAG: hypothetical protein FJ100_18970 [Deltaproteobacteria bacterium]|nr:hypothetical protein [Deltaproteobacteria bacterium]
MRCRPRLMPFVCALGCVLGCRQGAGDPPPVAEPTPVAGADVAVAPVNPPLQKAPAGDEDEPAPSGPAVEVRVADDPTQPLAWYRGFSSDRGREGAVLYSRKAAARSSVAILDGGVALRGVDKPTGVRKGPPRLVGPRPLLVSIGAKWCKPCSEELGDVVDLARTVRGAADDDEAGLLFSLQGVPDEWPLAEVRDEFVAKHKAVKKLKQAIQIPPWVEFRADIESNWGDAVGKLGLLGGDEVSLPVNLLLDRCGHVQAAASGALNEDKKQAFLKQAARLDAAGCTPAPVVVPALPRPAPSGPVKPRVDPKPGEGKTVPPLGAEPSAGKDEAGLKVPADDSNPRERPVPADAKAPASDKADPPAKDQAADRAKDGKPAESPKPDPAKDDKPAGGPAKDDKPKNDKGKDEKPATEKAKPDKPPEGKAAAPAAKEGTK